MSTIKARVVRCTLSNQAANIDTLARPASSLPYLNRPNQIRWNSSAAATAIQEDATKNPTIAEEILNTGTYTGRLTIRRVQTENRTPQLDKLFGTSNVGEAKALAADMRKVKHDWQQAHARTIEHPYKVRTTTSVSKHKPSMHVGNNRVKVGGKVIPNIWLRDNCQCTSCMHDDTKQRLLDTFSIPKDIAVKERTFNDNVLKIKWSDGHASSYTREFLGRAVQSDEQRAVVRQGLTSLQLWDSSIASSPPRKDYASTKGEDIQHVLQDIRKYGFCYVDNTPFDTPTATEEVLKRISFIRETHYGGFYDFTADLASKDTAYTNIALEAHTDTTYFSDPAGLQAFHLLSHTDGSGGASLLVDGFKVADELLQTDRTAYEILSTVNVHGHASGNEGISIQPYRGFPVLEHDTATGDLLRVRWNSSDRASIELPIEDVEKWYDAARKFDALLKKKENEYWEQLTPGRVLIFDNWRVLHGRSAFTGKRRICGGYVNRDDWISKFKMGQFGREMVMGHLASS